MSSPRRMPFMIPESLKTRKVAQQSLNASPSKRNSGGMRRMFPPRKASNEYQDFDSPSSSTSRENGGGRSRRIPHPNSSLLVSRQSLARAAQLVRRRSSAATGMDTVGDASGLPATSTAFGTSALSRRISSSMLGTSRSGVDNRVSKRLILRSAAEKSEIENRERPVERKGRLLKRNDFEESHLRSASQEICEPLGESPKKPSRNVPGDAKFPTVMSKYEVASRMKRLVGQHCPTPLDKLRVLEERDKLMCKARVKTMDVENATVVKGTCMDMCPEKERYMRLVQNRVNPYECSDLGSMQANLAVKDYSRSAADQEEPLPHELRPAPVLQRTMNYLIGKIADEMPAKFGVCVRAEDLAAWYDFLWTRTRAIRKDITQQMIVNDVAVTLTERCARLHIFVSHQLCMLSANEFDQKMNTENLTKCLLSLRYLYDDLSKRKVYCPNESEFRAYDLLLNLTDSSILRQVVNFRDEIRSSKSVRLALQLFRCFQSGNYRRFIRILQRDATYLQCCICHRYFTHIRTHALSVMGDAYTVRETNPARFPFWKISELLGYDGEAYAAGVLKQCGFRSEMVGNEEFVVVNRSDFRHFAERAPVIFHQWIESKRNNIDVCLVLSGGEFVPIVVNSVTDSFTPDGLYSLDPVLADYVTAVESGREKSEADADVNFSVQQFEPHSSRIPFMPLQHAEEILFHYVLDLIGGEVRHIVEGVHSVWRLEFLSSYLMDPLFGECLRLIAKEMVYSTRLSRRRQQAAKHAKIQKQLVGSLISSLTESVADDVVASNVESIAKESVHSEQIRQTVDTLCEEVVANLLNEAVGDNLTSVATAELDYVTKMKQGLGGIWKDFQNKWIKQFFDRWKNSVLARKAYENRQLQQLIKLSETLPGINYLRYPPLPRSSSYAMEKLFEMKVKAFMWKRHLRISKKAFLHWKDWTVERVKRNQFVKDFFRGSEVQKRVHLSHPGDGDSTVRLNLAAFEATRSRRYFDAAVNGVPSKKRRAEDSPCSSQDVSGRVKMEFSPVGSPSKAGAPLATPSTSAENCFQTSTPSSSSSYFHGPSVPPNRFDSPSLETFAALAALKKDMYAFNANLKEMLAEEQRRSEYYDKILNGEI